MTPAETPELKPCPFCGAWAKLMPEESVCFGTQWCVYPNCTCFLDRCKSDPSDAIRRWNARHEDKYLHGLNPEAIPAAIEALEKLHYAWHHGESLHYAMGEVEAALAAVKKEEVQP